MRGKPEKFADHYSQATLFYNRQTEVEKDHIAAAFRFEQTRVQTPADGDAPADAGFLQTQAGAADLGGSIDAFRQAVGKHMHYEREAQLA